MSAARPLELALCGAQNSKWPDVARKLQNGWMCRANNFRTLFRYGYGRNSVRKLFARRIKPFCSLRGTSCHFEFCAAHQTDLSDFATLKASLNFALRHRPRVKLPLAILGGISSNKYAPPIEL